MLCFLMTMLPKSQFQTVTVPALAGWPVPKRGAAFAASFSNIVGEPPHLQPHPSVDRISWHRSCCQQGQVDQLTRQTVVSSQVLAVSHF